ncbi:MAG: metal ABC transporter permease [Thiotrichales bacterium]|nr:metal ABC transporter permease [Thiotrichales bacterium]
MSAHMPETLERVGSALTGWSWTLDGWIVAVGVLCAMACALPGCFLVLRRMSMMGDAISHAVLPGLAAAFIISGELTSVPMFIGAVIAGLLTALFTEWLHGYGRVDEGASMGVVFTGLFAVGLVMIARAADNVHLDADCVLYGAIEFTPLDLVTLGGVAVPRVGLTLSAVLLVNLLFVVALFKEFKISAFDPALATTLGVNARFMHYLLMILTAITAVAAFEAVGSILVVALLIAPPAAAYLLTDRLPVMIGLSLVIGASAAVLGHIGALTVPAAFGYGSTSTAGMIAVFAGLLLALAALFGPRHGALTNAWRQRRLRRRRNAIAGTP